MGGVRDYSGSLGMQEETSVATSTGTRGGGCGGKNLLHRNAGKMTMTEAKTLEFIHKARKAWCPPRVLKHGGI